MNPCILEALSRIRERCSHGVACHAEAGRRRMRRLGQVLPKSSKLTLMIGLLCFAILSNVNSSPEEDAKTVAALDTKYQGCSQG